MGEDLKGAMAGGGSPSGDAREALGLPSSLLYFKWVPLASGASSRRDIRRFAAGAIDPDLPVAVEECLLHCAVRDGGIAVFAIEKSKLASATREFAASAGRECDCVVPVPLAAWDYASGGAATSAPDGAPLLHLDAPSTGGWTLCAGRVSRKGAAPLEAVMSVAAGDEAGASRASRILAGRLGGAPHLVVTGRGVSDSILAATASASGAAATIDLRGDAPDGAELVARYARRRYLTHDFPIEEAEGAVLRRRRAMRALLPAAILAAAASILAVSSIAFDLSVGSALRATDASIDRAAALLAGGQMRLKGPAAIEAARRSFAERAEPGVMRAMSEPPSEVLRTVLAFAETRSVSIAAIECDGKGVSFTLRPESDGDAAALEAELSRSGRIATMSRAENDGYNLWVGLEAGR